MSKFVVLGILFALGCNSNNPEVKEKLMPYGDPEHPLYVGHSTHGDIVVAATHYDAVNGLAVTADEVGQKTKEGMICSREMLTGTHVPSWVCRYNAEVAREREATQIYLSRPQNCINNCGSPRIPHTH